MKKCLFAAAILTLLAGCASPKPSVSALGNQASSPAPNAQQAGNYPPEALQTFVQGCMAGQPSTMEKPCNCMVRQIQVKYTYAQYQALVQAGSTTDPGMQEIVNSCADTQ